MMSLIKPITVNLVHELKSGGCGAHTPVQVYTIPGTYELHVTCAGCGQQFTHILEFKEVQQQLFHAFGDESTFGEVVVYGIAVLHDHDLKQVESDFANLKLEYKVPSWAEFHSRIVFNGDQRRKSVWKHLTENQVFECAKEIILCLKANRAMFSVGAVSKNEYPSEFPAGAGFPAGKMDTKQLMAVVFQAAMAPVTQNISSENIRLWIDPDKTRIKWFSKGIQADKNYRVVSSETKQIIQPMRFSEKEKPVLLQVADLFSYISAHVLSNQACRGKAKFEEIYKLCSPLLTVLTYDPEKRMRNEVPTSAIELNHAKITQRKM